MILQTTAYTRFEEFAERLQFAVNTVLAESENDGFGVIHRSASGTSTWSVQVPAMAFGPTCGEASMEYRTRSSSLDDTSSMSRAEGRRWLAATAGVGGSHSATRRSAPGESQSGGLKPSTSVDRLEEQCFDHPPRQRLPSAIRLALPCRSGNRTVASVAPTIDPSVPGGARADQPQEDPPHQRSRTDPQPRAHGGHACPPRGGGCGTTLSLVLRVFGLL